MNNIHHFKELSTEFVSHFLAGRLTRKPSAYLLSIRQNHGESLCDFLARFNREALDVDGIEDISKIMVMMNGLVTDYDFLPYLAQNSPKTYADLMAEAQKFIGAEEIFRA